ncbi:formin-like [Sinocyclocheilus rhinocerous]|uniref:formin-like n=1 Tax=Sinocyclocheilus rhinocerous TaxID=307959 RepID=UPI0007BA8A2B|nr:PREDICTED: formin-like [Sinocyclocheilus rhinocerous]
MLTDFPCFSCSFQEMVMYFGLKPKSGEKEVSPSFIFMLWYEFCNDFKSTWNRENKSISKERLKEAQQTVQKITAEKKVETKKTNANSLAPSMGRDMGFEPILKRPRVKQAQRNHRGSDQHEAEHPLEIP